mmetsp:Transcript_68482/g.164463  ORF Transcript_68482/g.164463 Transcript_68482/m.164463 type:complete len:84 (-) Transcript_68482:61-312(-)
MRRWDMHLLRVASMCRWCMGVLRCLSSAGLSCGHWISWSVGCSTPSHGVRARQPSQTENQMPSLGRPLDILLCLEASGAAQKF